MEKDKNIRLPKVYAIVVTYNGSQWIDKCFGSLIKSTIPSKIIAIDNGSTDNTPEIIKEKFPDVEVIRNDKNVGFGRANNIGLKKVLNENVDYAFLLNQDAWVENDTIEHLIKIQKTHQEFGVLSPLPFDGEGQELDYLYKLHYERKKNTNQEFLNKTFEIEFINAAAWLISNEIIRLIGAFHPCFKMYGEDKNYIDRIHYLKKYKIGITETTKYYHDRKNRYNIDRSSKKMIFDSKIKIKTLFFNPNSSRIKTFLNLIKYYSIVLVKGLITIRTYIKMVFFCMKYLFISIFKRKISVKL